MCSSWISELERERWPPKAPWTAKLGCPGALGRQVGLPRRPQMPFWAPTGLQLGLQVPPGVPPDPQFCSTLRHFSNFFQKWLLCSPSALGLPFGSSWGLLGRLFGSTWGLLGASWAQLGVSGAPLGLILGPPGRLLGSTWASWAPLGRLLDQLGALWARKWRPLDANWTPNGRQLCVKLDATTAASANLRLDLLEALWPTKGCQMGAKWTPNGRQSGRHNGCQCQRASLERQNSCQVQLNSWSAVLHQSPDGDNMQH